MLRRALLGPADDAWRYPDWLLPHQTDAARRIAGALSVFSGALLCDAVGLGKTYVGLAVATRYKTVTVVPPAVLAPQWLKISKSLDVTITVHSHESLSRRHPLPDVDLIIVDEAHRFRNPRTVRYDFLARHSKRAHLLLLTATPVVNRPQDLLGLVRLFSRDNAFALFGVQSIEEVLIRPSATMVVSALAPAIVARSSETAGVPLGRIPHAIDQPIVAPPPIEHEVLNDVVARLERLEFPSFAGGPTTELLRLHVHHRLASSATACVDCLRRHLGYLTRAVSEAKRGNRLSRRAARSLFGVDDEFQLEFDMLGSPGPHVSTSDLKQEHARIVQILRLLEGSGSNPKAAQLVDLIRHRHGAEPGHKTIVFSTAVSTAYEIASYLRWHHIAVVTGRGARIASGPLPAESALALFAPNARGAVQPPDCAPVDVLIATDLVSEGLNLQDADAVVHFDLPWNPHRLQQRIGRIARLGSPHRAVNVWWFAPPPRLERRLKLRKRIQAKMKWQRDLGVAVTSDVGTAKVLGRSLEVRETCGGSLTHRRKQPCFTVVQGPRAAVFAVRWQVGHHNVPDLLAIAGTPPSPIADTVEKCRLLELLLNSHPVPNAPSAELQRVLATALRARLGGATSGPVNGATKRLARSVLRQALRAGAARCVERLDVLDTVLEQLTRGASLGAERELENALANSDADQSLREWLGRWSTKETEIPVVTLDAAIFGDGTRICEA